MQFGFQRSINTLHAALDIVAVVEAELGYMLAILELAKASDRVIRNYLWGNSKLTGYQRTSSAIL